MKRASQPVLAIYGTQDRAVPAVQSSRELAATLERGGNRSYKIRFFAGADHGLRASDGGFVPGYLDTMVAWVKGLPATAEPAPETQIAGATPVQRYAAHEPPAPPPYATTTALAVALGLAGTGFLASLIAAFVTGRGGKPADDAEAWLRIRSLLRWLAVSGVSTHLLFNLTLGASIVIALTQTGSPLVVNGGWLFVRLVALVNVALAVASPEAVVSAGRDGWRPNGAQAVSLVGSFGATGILLLVAAYWGLFAFRW